MARLDLLKERGYHVISIKERAGKSKDLLVPFELTVEEVERLLELQALIDRASQSDIDDDDVEKQLKEIKKMYNLMFLQLEIIIQHFQPEITADYLKKVLTEKDAVQIVQFFEQNRMYQNNEVLNTSSKKKII